MPEKPSSESLPELIARKRSEQVFARLSMIAAEQQGLKTLPESYTTGDNALVYDMGLLILDLLETEREKKLKELRVLNQTVIPLALPEIEELYTAIKKVGLKDYMVKGTDKTIERWRDAVLARYDDSKKGFQAIHREDLQELDLYQFRPGKEKEDFKVKLLQNILVRAGFNKYGMELLKAVLKQKPT